MATTQADLDHLRGHVEECRNDDFSGFDCLNKALLQGQATSLQLGSTDTEIDGFRERWTVRDHELAQQYLAEAKADEFENLPRLVEILSRRRSVRIQLGVSEEEVQGLIDTNNIRAGREIVAQCREGNFSRLPEIAEAIDQLKFSPEDLETSEDELAIFVRQLQLDWAKQAVVECREGNFTTLVMLRHDLVTGRYSAEQIGTTKDEVDHFIQTGIVEILNQIAAECRQYNYRNLEMLKKTMKQFSDTKLIGLDFEPEEVGKWRRMAELTGTRMSPPSGISIAALA